VVIRRDTSQGAPARLRARDGSAVTVVPVAPGGTPEELGFFSGGEDMRRRVERFIESTASLQSAGPWRPDAVVLATNPDDISRSAPQIDDWAARFAYPKIVAGKWDDYATTVAAATVTAPAPHSPGPQRQDRVGRSWPPRGRPSARHGWSG